MATELPGVTDAPVSGLDEMTRPAAYWFEAADDTPPTLSPAFPSATPAAGSDRPTSDGTSTSAGPDDTVRTTVLPWGTEVPADGLELSTVPFWTVLVLLYTSPSPRDGLLSRMPS